MGAVIEHSANAGRTWEHIELHPRPLIAHRLTDMTAYQVHDDGYGNLYRWRPSEDGAS